MARWPLATCARPSAPRSSHNLRAACPRSGDESSQALDKPECGHDPDRTGRSPSCAAFDENRKPDSSGQPHTAQDDRDEEQLSGLDADIEGTRLRAAAGAGFVLALYNPASRARPWQLARALDVLREFLPPATAVVFGRAALRPDERIVVTSLGEADAALADMATCVIVGSAETRTVARPGLPPLVYSPRSTGASAR